MPPLITGKDKASRIPLDYYKHPDRMVRLKRYLTWGAGALTLVWIISLLPAGERSRLGNRRFSHGPVANVHQPIDHDCGACHVSFGLFASGKPFRGDQKCQQCHYEDPLATHHASQKVSMTPNCGTCHSDHHGRDANLNRVANRDCVLCHKDLKDSMEGTPRYDLKITSFAKQHPDFRDLHKGDPGKLKFNHKYHMTEGIVLTRGGKPFTLANIPAGALRERYRQRGQKDDAAVKLECASCHTPEARDKIGKIGRPNPIEQRAEWEGWSRDFFKRKLNARGRGEDALLPPRKPGAYMAPIVYENHCAACHPLSFDARLTQQVPHRTQPDKLRAYLKDVYEKDPRLLTPGPSVLLPLPGKRPGGASKVSVGEKVQQALRSLLEGKRACGECHLAEGGGSVNLNTSKIAKPNIPQTWFKHARFDHGAHTSRGISCRECHSAAYATNEHDLLADSAKPRQGAEAVMIGGIKECRQCHSPKPEPKFVEAGWQAKHDCTECHTYHNGKAGTNARAGGFHKNPHREAWLRRPRRK